MAMQRSHDEELALIEKNHQVRIAQRQQLARLFVIVLIVGVWLAQTAYVTVHAVGDPLILVDIEKFIGLIAVTGGVAAVIIMKLWPQTD